MITPKESLSIVKNWLDSKANWVCLGINVIFIFLALIDMRFLENRLGLPLWATLFLGLIIAIASTLLVMVATNGPDFEDLEFAMTIAIATLFYLSVPIIDASMRHEYASRSLFWLWASPVIVVTGMVAMFVISTIGNIVKRKLGIKAPSLPSDDR